MSPDAPVFFEERQGAPVWVRVLILGIPASLAYFSYQQLFLSRPVGNRPMSDGGLAALDAFLILLFVFLWRLRLVTTVRPGSLRVRLWPLANREIAAADIERLEVRTYRPLAEYGGWGLRMGGLGEMAYTMSGNRGVQLNLRNGKSVLVGSQRPEELASALQMAGVAVR